MSRTRIRMFFLGGNKVIVDLETASQRAWQAEQAALVEASQIAVEKAKALAPVRLGWLRKSIKAVRLRGGEGFTLGNDYTIAPYGRVLNNGRDEGWWIRAHGRTMAPRTHIGRSLADSKPGFLRFKIGGKIFFAKEVYHPAVEGLRFMERGMEQSLGEIAVLMRARIEAAVKGK